MENLMERSHPSDVWWPSFCNNRSYYDAFWSYELSVNTSNPDLTQCMQNTALTWIPTWMFLFTSIVYIYYLTGLSTKHTFMGVSKINTFKTFLNAVMVLCLFVCIILWARNDRELPDFATSADYLALFSKLISMLVLLFLVHYEFRKGIQSSGCVFLFLFFITMVECFTIRSYAMRYNDPEDFQIPQGYFVVYCIYFTALALQFVLHLFADKAALKSPFAYYEESGHESTPLITANGHNGFSKAQNNNYIDVTKKAKPLPEIFKPFWARLTFLWSTEYIVNGYKNSLRYEDLYDIRDEEKCDAMVPDFMHYYYDKDPPKPGKPKNIAWALLMSGGVGTAFAISSLCRLISIPITFVNPQLLDYLITLVATKDPETWKGVFLSFCIFFTNICVSILLNNFLFYGMIAGLRSRSIVNAVVYRKALQLSSSAKRQTTVGQVVSLMSVDAQKVQDFYQYFSLLWSVPLMIAGAMYFLWQIVGPASLAGLLVLLIIIPLNALFFARKALKLQMKQMKVKDTRFRLINEILAGMKVLKLYAWEPSFQRQVLAYREVELDKLKKANYINAFGAMCWLLSPYLVSLAVFSAYIMADPSRVLTPSVAFVSLSLINLLNWPMSLLPMGVANSVQGFVSLGRISKFLSLEELDEDAVEQIFGYGDNVIKVEDGTFSWSKEDTPVLSDINLAIQRGKLVAIVGQVGSGKSSLVQAMLGELHKKRGYVAVNGTLAYVPQQAWIQYSTLRENILFGRPFSHTKYQEIVKACALASDLAILPGGDFTEIGEKGINLSGGQKQRVSLARALYQNEDVYLLDDPLSAVDAHVGKHIFEKVIGPHGVLKDKTRILVTHGVTYLPQVDQIVVLNEGRITETGGYQELLDRNGDFADFVRTYLNEEPIDSDTETEEIRSLRRRFSESEFDGSMSGTGGSGLENSSTGGLPRRRQSVRRASSRASTKEEMIDRSKQKEAASLVKEEGTEVGNIKFGILKSYVKAGTYLMFNIVLGSHLMFMVAQVLTNIWLSDWSNDISVNDTYNEQRNDYRLGFYGGLGAAQMVFALGEAFAVAHGSYRASRVLHNNLLTRILRAPMSFFDTTPLGRIMNRFSKDMDILDYNMPMFTRQWLFAMAPVVVVVIIITYSTPIFGVVIIPLIIFFLIAQRMYITTARQLKRIDGVRRSPIYIHFDETVVGSASIRAYKRQQDFIDKFDVLVDESQRAWNLILISYRWCGIVMEFIGNLIVFFAALFATLERDSISAGVAGLSVSYSLQIVTYINALIRNSSELETYVVSVERINEYCQIDSEAAWTLPNYKPPPNWPSTGHVEFKNYSTRYRAGLDLVLRDVNCEIKSCQKVGIVGRTGAGKSSLSLALFRIIESAGGQIEIDGEVISNMGLHDLRSQIAVIPQDPVVFSGSLRKNLDPFDIYSDEEVWTALTHAHLKEFIKSQPDGLQYECGESGEALSVGQRQLVCLARALLRRSKILILDEATAAVDLETDALIQTTIREQFKDCTILTVAHRLNTVMDYDKIMVLEKGKIREFGAPNKLLSERKSIFYSMAKDANLV